MYTTKKKTGKLINQYIFAWVIIGVAVIKLAFKNYSHFDSFQALGSFIDVFALLVLGIAVVVSSNKKIKQIKGIEFDINESEFIYKTHDEALIFDKNTPAKSITKTIEAIVIKTQGDREITLFLDNFSLNYEELKKLDTLIPNLNQNLQNPNYYSFSKRK